MYINKLHLRAFGKFAYKKLFFENKLNIVYGENEAGKSTIHNFIEAILYGFDENEAGVEKYNKYKPWDSNIYKGSLSIKNSSGESHIISKDFLLGTTQVLKKNKDETQINDEEIVCPGEHYFNMNKVSFTNTVSVRQLGNKTDRELAQELKNKIINLSKTRDESISIERILQRLSSIKEEAGDESNDKTLLGQYSLRLSELKNAREKSLIAKRQVMFLAMEKKKLTGKIQEMNLRIEELSKEICDYDLSVEKDKFLRAEPIKKELDQIYQELLNYNEHDLKKYADTDFKEAVNLENVLNSMYVQRRKLDNEKTEKEEELNNLLLDISNKFTEQFNIENFNQEYKKYIDNIAVIKELKSKIGVGKESIEKINIDEINSFFDSYNKIEEINRKIDLSNIYLDNENYEKMNKYRSSQIKNVVLFVVLASSLTAGVWWLSYEFNHIIKSFIDNLYSMQGSVNIAAGIAIALIAIITALIIKPILNKLKSAKNEIDSMECEFADYTISLDMLNKEKQEIIYDTGCQGYDEIAERFNKLSAEKDIYEEKNKLISFDIESLNKLEHENTVLKSNLIKSLLLFDMLEINNGNIDKVNNAYSRKDIVKNEAENLKNSMEQLKQSIAKLDKEISFEEKRFNMILSSNGMEDLDSFKKAVEYNEKYIELTNNRDYKEDILYKIIGDESFEALKDKTKNVKFYEVKKLDKQDHQMKIFKLNDEKARLLESIDNMLREIDEIENSSRGLAEIEEEIDFYENKINAFKRKIKIAEIAAERIVKISDSIKGDFMPLLRRTISDNFAYLTGGKYSEVVIDEEMNITVIEAENKQRNIELESLSGGTLDQLYLSLRVGLGNILSGNQSIPLIFDDSFVQYDSKRLRNSIEMLAKESERRQIILFTCQEREAESAQKMNIRFNYVKL